ncbi:Aste57867_879 [Aphanomyces stellatus]|uniref:Aste57867_879 protein n=1 Tax=Aphanomyces stellatus TaxID=120398 RepID=A0A485K440_9STRA|nr:hypothetical protein As57867_000878 [Aphanomyces stellatus]VFT78103.1 Aste57867_879 [Aphanomyces stellatus]
MPSLVRSLIALVTVAKAAPLFSHDEPVNHVARSLASTQDLAFVQLPTTQKILAGLGGNPALLAAMLNDTRLDIWTHLMLAMVQVKMNEWHTPRADSNITVPTIKMPLTKLSIPHTTLEVPTQDEDWPDDPPQFNAALNYMRDYAPFVDNLEATWQAGEDKEAYVMSKVGKMWPPVHVAWTDRYSDKALSQVVFSGMGSHVIEKLPKTQADGSYYGVLLNFMDQLDVRSGFAKYGADAYFDKHGNVVKIIRQNKTYFPGSNGWEYAKMTFRGSLMVKITVVDHLLGLHAVVGNYIATAAREQLPPNHPLRRLLKPFTFRAVEVVVVATRALFATNGFLHRGHALSETGMQDVWSYGLKQFHFETFPETVRRQRIDTVSLPFHTDGLDFWDSTRSFVSDYVDLYYDCDEAVTRDASLAQFWRALDSKFPKQLRPLTMETLKDTMAQFIVWTTGMHNHVGSIADYVRDPAFTPPAWIEGQLAAPPGYVIRAAIIMAATSFSQPSILEDFSHVMLDDDAKSLCHEFTDDLKRLSKKIDRRNRNRAQAFQSFNPKFMDISVGI